MSFIIIQQCEFALISSPNLPDSIDDAQLAYLPDRKREYMIDDDAGSYVSELSSEARDDITNLDELVKDFKKSKRRGMLGWFKMRVRSYIDSLFPLKR